MNVAVAGSNQSLPIINKPRRPFLFVLFVDPTPQVLALAKSLATNLLVRNNNNNTKLFLVVFCF